MNVLQVMFDYNNLLLWLIRYGPNCHYSVFAPAKYIATLLTYGTITWLSLLFIVKIVKSHLRRQS